MAKKRWWTAYINSCIASSCTLDIGATAEVAHAVRGSPLVQSIILSSVGMQSGIAADQKLGKLLQSVSRSTNEMELLTRRLFAMLSEFATAKLYHRGCCHIANGVLLYD